MRGGTKLIEFVVCFREIFPPKNQTPLYRQWLLTTSQEGESGAVKGKEEKRDTFGSLASFSSRLTPSCTFPSQRRKRLELHCLWLLVFHFASSLKHLSFFLSSPLFLTFMRMWSDRLVSHFVALFLSFLCIAAQSGVAAKGKTNKPYAPVSCKGNPDYFEDGLQWDDAHVREKKKGRPSITGSL